MSIVQKIGSLLVCCALALTLAGCLLASGERTTIDLQGVSGNVNTVFVSAEGEEIRSLKVADNAVDVQVITIVAVESGDVQLDVYQADGSVAFNVASRPDGQVTRSAVVRANDDGEVRYRVLARNARNGSYQIFFQP
ncbi:hypothetical protein HC891_09675 [Candidatus Gracilibacteria bacterium]|nr:hypothetical protein [Candidatus Gracilibacteria bacterium]